LVTSVNPTEVFPAWTASTDDGLYLFYQVLVNGSPSVDAGQRRFAVVKGLSPETTYQFTVKARDLYGPPNMSAPSNIVTVTTYAVGGVDTEPPSAPSKLFGWDAGDEPGRSICSGPSRLKTRTHKNPSCTRYI